jgi:hypothetical protein
VTEIKSGLRFTCPFFWEILKHTGERQPWLMLKIQ